MGRQPDQAPRRDARLQDVIHERLQSFDMRSRADSGVPRATVAVALIE